MQVKVSLIIISAIILCILYVSCVCISNRFALISEKRTAEYILRNTHIGSSKEDVRKFIEERKGFEISASRIQDRPHILGGETFPIDYPRDIYRRYSLSSRVGHSNIYVVIANIFNHFLYADCTWVFDIEINKNK